MKGENMLTIQGLKDLGVNTAEGVARCINNESFYIRMVSKGIESFGKFDDLKAAVDKGDLDSAFAVAHDLKGLTGNLSLTQLYEPVSEITELLRAHTEMDYTPLMNVIMERRDAMVALSKS